MEKLIEETKNSGQTLFSSLKSHASIKKGFISVNSAILELRDPPALLSSSANIDLINMNANIISKIIYRPPKRPFLVADI